MTVPSEFAKNARENAVQTLISASAIAAGAVTTALAQRTRFGGRLYTHESINPACLAAGLEVYFVSSHYMLTATEQSTTVAASKKKKTWLHRIGLSGTSRYVASVLGITTAALMSRLSDKQQLLLFGGLTTSLGLLAFWIPASPPSSGSGKPPPTPARPET